VQHITNGFLPGLVEWLQVECRLTIEIASAGEFPFAGRVYLPPENRHLEIGRDGRFLISDGDMVSGHRPSVTVTMRSAASYYRDGAVGVLLSGMGRDGADGMLAIARAGGTTIAQDERSSTVFGMPKQAIELGAAHYILNPGEIGRHLLTMVRSSSAGDVPSQ
jgi:two-component system chemotaxis response regulator CheB